MDYIYGIHSTGERLWVISDITSEGPGKDDPLRIRRRKMTEVFDLALVCVEVQRGGGRRDSDGILYTTLNFSLSYV